MGEGRLIRFVIFSFQLIKQCYNSNATTAMLQQQCYNSNATTAMPKPHPISGSFNLQL
jgi:hypothetical protein